MVHHGYISDFHHTEIMNLIVGVVILGCFVLETHSQGTQVGPCVCTDNWAKCDSGWGEDGARGCGGTGKSCAEHCPGDGAWKDLYRKTVAMEATLESECSGDPTKKWGPMSGGTEGPFAIAFSGGLRNFVANWGSWESNVVEMSGGMDNVHTFFHVYHDERGHYSSPLVVRGRELAKSLPCTKAYVDEPISEFVQLLHDQEPGFGPYGPGKGPGGTNTSWLTALEADFPPGHRRGSPYVFGPGYSQFRKVHLCHELIKRTGIDYSIIIRARPDHLFILPLDLRKYAAEFAAKPAVKRARGHFFAMAERHQGALMTDHFAMGTKDVMFAYAERPLPYTLACCEGYVMRNTHMRCFARDESVLQEDFVGGAEGVKKVAEVYVSSPQKNEIGWSVIPQSLRASKYSPIINNGQATGTYGSQACFELDRRRRSSDDPERVGSSCIPAYRIAYTYIYNIVTQAWLHTGVVCIGRYAGHDEEQFLLFSGYATESKPEVAKKFGFGPCVVVPTVAKAYEKTQVYLAALKPKDRDELMAMVGRRR